jgi:ABC-type bacteriocin/lantibiotic exporter with double-glycine peptidase domain
MMELQAALSIGQKRSHCGACATAYALATLGIDVSQRDLAHAGGVPWRIWWRGMDENEIKRAARRYGVASRFLLIKRREWGWRFVSRLRRHLRRGRPAILLVNTYGGFGHWIPALRHTRGKFVVADPAGVRMTTHWGVGTLLRRGWNVDPDGEEPSQFFAVLLHRRRAA